MSPTLGSVHSLDRKSEKRNDAAWLDEVRADGAALFLVLVDAKPVIVADAERTETEVRWYARGELEGLGLAAGEALFLGVDRGSGAGRFALAISEETVRDLPDWAESLRPAVDLRSLAMQGAMPAESMAIVGLAKSLAHWQEACRHCGRCGAATVAKDGGWKRKCSECGQEHFPRLDPVVIMLVLDPERNRCLMGHAARFESTMYSALAGYIEPGEGIEDAVRRETLEEAGIEVGEVRYHSVQPWPFPHTLMIGCFGLARTVDITVDPEELTDARWFSRDEVIAILDGRHPDGITAPKRHAIAYTLLETFARGEAMGA